MEVFDINRGIKAYLAADDKFCSCGFAVLFKRELKKDEVTKNALLANVLGLGCADYPSPSALGRAAAGSFGGGFDCVNMKKGGFQLLEFYADCVNEGDNVKNALGFLRNVIFEPLTDGEGFKAEYVERAKKGLREIILSRKDDKKQYARERLFEEMFDGEGAGIPGDGYAEEVCGISPRELYSHYKRVISQSEILIIAVGGFDSETVKRGLRAFDIGGREQKISGRQTERRKKPKMISEEMDVEQSKLCVGISLSGDYYETLTANEIFGGCARSRLFLKAREEEGLCYYISSSVCRGLNACVLQSGVSLENAERVIEIVKRELSEMENLSDKEIDSAKEGLAKRYSEINDDLSGLENFCLGAALWGGAASPNEAKERIMSLENNKVKNAFKDAQINTVYLLKGKG